MRTKLCGAMLTTTLILGMAGAGLAAGASAGSDPAIPDGTIITTRNWQAYKGYLSDGLQGAFAGLSQVFHVSAAAQVEVGPFVPYLPPRQFFDNTEKYSKQVRLVRADTGSYNIQGYVAGEPFPNISAQDPLAGYKVFYDIYYDYAPAAHFQINPFILDMDRYQNVITHSSILISYRMMHLSDIGYPVDLPGNSGVLQTTYSEIMVPEQSKYTTALNLAWSDPNRFPESYIFLPSLRRALRLSSAARCAPFQGQDFTNDDVPVPQPPVWFQAKFLERKKMLWMVFSPDPASMKRSADYTNNYYHPLLWPKRSLGKWQLRDTYVIELQRLPQFAEGYCYSKRKMYMDAATTAQMAWDTWDSAGRQWRSELPFTMPEPVPKGGYSLNPGWSHVDIDFQNQHISVLVPGPDPVHEILINSEIPSEYINYARYGTPAGLAQVMQ